MEAISGIDFPESTEDLDGVMLDQVNKAHIFAVQKADEGFLLYDRCDCHFGAVLSADELIGLGHELIAAAKGG